ncbi:MAG TPA: GNAT family N-acetyltransferase [Alloacidobacterium sp.]|nr:GNAT family N-acetyltransferase [Alloacidobacterium sp.]
MSEQMQIEPGLLSDGELSLELVSFAPHRTHLVPTYHFRIVHSISGEEMGQINLRSQTNITIERYAGHIGYGVYEPFRGHRYAARSVSLILPLARKLGIDPLWITCDPQNTASRRSCEIAGAEFIEIVDLPPDYSGYAFGQRQKCRYRL